MKKRIKNKERDKNYFFNQKTAKEKQKTNDFSEITLMLDSYNDIFSDFDSRPYSQKALSFDFLQESERASRDKIFDGIELKLLVPCNKRDNKEELVIKKRLKDHFNKHFNLLKKEARNTVKQGSIFVSFGFVTMMLTTFILSNYGEPYSFFIAFLVLLLEPAGWFLLWEGMAIVLFEPKKIKPNLDFYEKMSKCSIKFLSC